MSSLDEKTVDAIFSELEKLAFRGKWDDKEKNKVWRECGLPELESSQGTNYFHDRLTLLMNVYSTRSEVKRTVGIEGLMWSIVQTYYSRYPGSRDNMPTMLRRSVEKRIKEADMRGGDS